MDNPFEFIKADKFFKKYLPHIVNFKHKMRGKSGRGKELDFTPEEKKEIMQAIRKMFRDILHFFF